MTKKWLAALAVGVLVLAKLAGCDGNDAVKEEVSPVAPFPDEGSVEQKEEEERVFASDPVVADFMLATNRSWTMEPVAEAEGEWAILLKFDGLSRDGEQNESSSRILVEKYTTEAGLSAEERFALLADLITEGGKNGEDYLLEQFALKEGVTREWHSTYAASRFVPNARVESDRYEDYQKVMVADGNCIYVFSAMGEVLGNESYTYRDVDANLLERWQHSFAYNNWGGNDGPVLRSADTYFFYYETRVEEYPEKGMRTLEDASGIFCWEYRFALDSASGEGEEYTLNVISAGEERAEWYRGELLSPDGELIQTLGLNACKLFLDDRNGDGWLDFGLEERFDSGEQWLWQPEEGNFAYEKQPLRGAPETLRRSLTDSNATLFEEEELAGEALAEKTYIWEVEEGLELELRYQPVAHLYGASEDDVICRIQIFEGETLLDTIYVYSENIPSEPIRFGDVDFDGKVEMGRSDAEGWEYYYRWSDETKMLEYTTIDLNWGFRVEEWIDEENEIIWVHNPDGSRWGEYQIKKWFGNELRVVRVCEYTYPEHEENPMRHIITDYPYGKSEYGKMVFAGLDTDDDFDWALFFGGYADTDEGLGQLNTLFGASLEE